MEKIILPLHSIESQMLRQILISSKNSLTIQKEPLRIQ